MDAEQRAYVKMESALYKLVGRIMCFHEDPHILQIEDELEALARKLGQPEPDRRSLRLAFMRAFLGSCWQRLEAHYGYYAGAKAFELRLDVWCEAFGDIARPLRLLELLNLHMEESPRQPVISDIARRLGKNERLSEPARGDAQNAARPKAETHTPGFGRRTIEEWLAQRRQA